MAFNNVGLFSLAANASMRLDGWQWPDGGDRGAQYFSAHPLGPDAKLVMTEQNKTLGRDGRTSYGFRVTNEGPREVRFSVQGGGFINSWTQSSGNGLIIFGNDEDHGAQFCSASPLDTNVTLVMNLENKTQLHAGQTIYGFGFAKQPNLINVRYRVQGGGFANGFNGVGAFTLVSGASIRLDGWLVNGGADFGAFYFAAHPQDAFQGFAVTEQNKMLGRDGRFSYGFRVTSQPVITGRGGSSVNGFSVQGGGFV